MGAYNPVVGDQAGSFLYEGLSGMGRSLGAGLDKLNEQQQKAKDEEKRRSDLFKSLVTVADTTGIMSKEKALTMDLPTLQGVLEGVAQKKRNAAEDLQGQVNAQHLTQLTQQNESQAALGRMGADLSGTPPTMMDLMRFDQGSGRGPLMSAQNPAGGVGGADFNAALLQSLRRNPAAMAAPQFDNSIAALEKARGGPNGGTFFRTNEKGRAVPITGAPGFGQVAMGPNQSQLVYTGGVTGGEVPLPGGGAASFISPKPGQATLIPGQTLTAEDALKAYNANQDRLHKLRGQLKLAADPATASYFDTDAIKQELDSVQSQQDALKPIFNRNGAPASGPAGAIKSVSTQAEYDALPRGSVYVNKKTGKQFTKP